MDQASDGNKKILTLGDAICQEELVCDLLSEGSLRTFGGMRVERLRRTMKLMMPLSIVHRLSVLAS